MISPKERLVTLGVQNHILNIQSDISAEDIIERGSVKNILRNNLNNKCKPNVHQQAF